MVERMELQCVMYGLKLVAAVNTVAFYTSQYCNTATHGIHASAAYTQSVRVRGESVARVHENTVARRQWHNSTRNIYTTFRKLRILLYAIKQKGRVGKKKVYSLMIRKWAAIRRIRNETTLYPL